MKELEKFFNPKSIAIVGASPKKGKLGNVLEENIRKDGWPGKLFFVNPKYSKKSAYYSSLSEIGKPVDLVLVAIPAPLIGAVLEDGAKSRPSVKNFAIISAGFKESGPEGKELENQLANLGKRYGLNILGPNCLGFANSFSKLNATFTEVKLLTGNISIASQSGALAVALLDWAHSKNIGFSKIISIGNKAVLSENEIVNFLLKDKNTNALALYLEDVKNGELFLRTLLGTKSKKPIVILKAGKTAAGQKAVSSHTGSLAQDEEIIEAALDKANVIQTGDIGEFQDILYYLNLNPVPNKNEVIVLTNAGGPGVMASDFIGNSKELRLLRLTPDFKNNLKKFLPASASVQNPIDVIGDAPPERYEKALDFIARRYRQNPIVVILTPQNQTDPEKVAELLARRKKAIPNLTACFMGGEKITRAKEILDQNKIPNFENPERALQVIETLTNYSGQKPNTGKIFAANSPEAKRPRLFQEALSEGRKMLSWKETEILFRKQGIRLSRSVSVRHADDLKNKNISYPCVLKTDDPKIAHRWEKKAVILNLQNESALATALAKAKKETKAGQFLVQPMLKSGLEMIFGMKRDPSFGPVMLVGLGGTMTEVFKDKVLLIPPFDRREIADKIGQLKIFPVLRGFRGENGYDLSFISDVLLALQSISLQNPEISEIDINPAILYNDTKTAQIVDAKIFIR